MIAGANRGGAQNMDWSTRVTQCSVPSTTEDCLCGLFCCPCSYATAKSNVDGTSACFDCLCWNPVASRNFIRHEYNIPGVCGDDIGYTVFCPFCVGRQVLTESKLRGRSQQPRSGTYGANTDRWNISLFDCDFCSCLQVFVCPCYVTSQLRLVMQPNAAPDGCINNCCIFPTSLYGQVRHYYGIAPQNPDCPVCEDVFVALFCYPCAIIRAKKETMHRQPVAAVMSVVKQYVK